RGRRAVTIRWPKARSRRPALDGGGPDPARPTPDRRQGSDVTLPIDRDGSPGHPARRCQQNRPAPTSDPAAPRCAPPRARSQPRRGHFGRRQRTQCQRALAAREDRASRPARLFLNYSAGLLCERTLTKNSQARTDRYSATTKAPPRIFSADAAKERTIPIAARV